MNRRELLGAVGVGAAGIAGVVGASADGAGQDAGTTTAGTTTAAGGDGDESAIDSSADRPFATISVGTRAGVQNPENNRPHAIRVWNDSERSRTLRLRLVRSGAGGDSPPVDRRVEFPADGYLTMRLLEPANYRLDVSVGPAGGTTTGETTTSETATRGGVAGEIEVPRARFDCNDSWTDVVVTADGRVRATTVTTEIGCPPEVVDRTFTAFGGSCGSTDEASVAFADDSVRVTGSVRTPNPCYGAELAEVSVPSADTLRVVVATTGPTADFCTQCIGTVEYRADLTFRDRVPGTVEVVHRRDGETVATVTRGGETTQSDAETTTRSE